MLVFAAAAGPWFSRGVIAQGVDRAPVIGILAQSAEATLRDQVFERRLRELGWVDGKNVRLEYRRAGNLAERLPVLAEELVRMKVDLIVAQATPAVKAARDATRASGIPVVSISADPVSNGFVASLARAGGNITGVSMMMFDLAGKSLELLREISPKLSRVAYLAYGRDPSHAIFLRETEEAGRRLGVRIQPVILQGPDELEAAFATMKNERVGAVVVQPIFSNTMNLAGRIAALALKHGLLSVSSADNFANEGGLLFSGPDAEVIYEVVADFAHRVLKGAKPADLPMEQPRRFYLALNTKTAQALGVRVPNSLLLRVDRVIR